MPEITPVCRSAPHRGLVANRHGAQRTIMLMLIALGGWLMAGCAPLERLFGAPPAEPTPPPPDVMLYLETLQSLAQLPADEQAALLSQLDQAHNAEANATNTLRLALALSAPGIASAQPQRGRELLLELLAEDATLLPAERMLAELHLAYAELRLAELAARAAADAAAVADRVERSRREQTLAAENQRLAQALREAEAKLEAITTIERAMRERD